MVEAKTDSDIETFSSQDPFVEVVYESVDGTQSFTTSVLNEAGKHAVWGEEP